MVKEHDAQLVAIESLRPFEGNPRRGNVEVIRESLRVNGQYRPVVVRTQTKEILAGNHTWEAARQEGWEQIWATFISCDQDQARRINLVDNRAPELGGYDGEALMEMLQALPDLEGSGWSGDDLEELVGQLTPPDPSGDSGDSGDGSGRAPGVLLVCESSTQQHRVQQALVAAATGDVSLLPLMLVGLEPQLVTV